MLKSLLLSMVVSVAFAAHCDAQVGHLWTYSQASPTGNAYEFNEYGAFPVYPLGAWRAVGYDPYYDDCCWDDGHDLYHSYRRPYGRYYAYPKAYRPPAGPR